MAKRIKKPLQYTMHKVLMETEQVIVCTFGLTAFAQLKMVKVDVYSGGTAYLGTMIGGMADTAQMRS